MAGALSGAGHTHRGGYGSHPQGGLPGIKVLQERVPGGLPPRLGQTQGLLLGGALPGEFGPEDPTA